MASSVCIIRENRMIQDFTAVDVETTGLNPKTDKLIEVGAVKVRNGQLAGSFESFLSPGRKLDPMITQLTGITDGMLSEAPLPEEVMPKLLDFIGSDILLGHSLMFDFAFIKRAAANAGLLKPGKRSGNRQINRNTAGQYDLEAVRGIDTLKLSRQLMPELESRSLPFLCRHFEILHNAHRALEDARAAALLYQRLGEKFTAADALVPAVLHYKVKREAPAGKAQKERLYMLVNKHKLFIDYEIDRLTRNEASRIIDKIISEYGRG